jgi:hypothetical protein
VGTTLFWVETLCCSHGQKGTVKRVGIAGGEPVTVRGDIDSPVAVIADAANVFWLEGGSIGEIEGFGRIGRMSHAGAAVITVTEAVDVKHWSTTAPRRSGFFDVDATHLYFVDKFTIKRVGFSVGLVERVAIANFHVADVATDGSHVYWIEADVATVRRVAVTGGSVTTIGTANAYPGSIALDATHVYWSVGNNAVMRAPKTGGTPEPVTGFLAGGLTDFLVADGIVYFSEWDSGALRKIPVGGGTAQLLTTLDADQTRRISVHGNRVYWADQNDVGYVATTGGNPAFIVREGVASSPFQAGDIVATDIGVFWSEVEAAIIKRAVPK